MKRLGDSVMATFPSAQDAVGAALDAQEGVDEVSVGEHRPLEAAACRRRTAGTVHCSRRQVLPLQVFVHVHLAAHREVGRVLPWRRT